MRDVKVEAVRSDGQRFTYEGEGWKLLELQGADFTEIDVTTDPKAFGNGVIVSGKRKLAREITVVARMLHKEDYFTQRDKAIGFHNSNYTFDVHLTYLGKTLVARNCVIKAANYPTINTHNQPSITIMFLAPDSDLYADTFDEISFSSQQAAWAVTRAYEGQGGKLHFGAKINQNSKIVNYLGSEDAEIVLALTSTGQVSNIRVRLNEHELAINETLRNGDVLIINAEQKEVYKNSLAIPYNRYDMAVLMNFKLKYGDNTITINGSDIGAISSVLAYTGRYGGI